MNDFEQWLTLEFSAAANDAPLKAPLPSQAAYQRTLIKPRQRSSSPRIAGKALAFALAVIAGLSASAAHTLNPLLVAQQAAQSLRACGGDLIHGQPQSCVADFTNSHVDQLPVLPPVPLPVPTPTPIPSPTASASPSPHHSPSPSASPRPTPTAHSTVTPSPSGGTTVLFSENFQQDTANLSPPSPWSTDSGGWTVAVDGSNRYASPTGTTANALSLGYRSWTGVTISGAVRLGAGSSDADIAFNVHDASNYDYCGINHSELVLGKAVGGQFTILGSEPYTSNSQGTVWTPIQIQTSGTGFACTLSGSTSHVLTGSDSGASSGGGIALLGGGSGVGFDEILVATRR